MPHVLIVCTANRCRSPIGEFLLRGALDAEGGVWEVSSAGLLPSGSPVVDEVQDVMERKYGLDLSQHRSRRLSAHLIEEVDLVLGMERRHIREVATYDPSALNRSFTVKEFVRRAEMAPCTGQPFADYFALLSSGRPSQVLLGRDPADEIEDPIGRGLPVFEASAAELAENMDAVARVLANLD